MRKRWFFLFSPCALFSKPPLEIPSKHYAEFTLNDQIEVSSYYLDNSYSPKEPLVYEKATIEKLRKKALAREENYYGATDIFLYAAFDAYPIRGKKVAIMGSTIPWYEAVVLAYGGHPVVIEYNKIVSKHPEVRTMTVAEYEAHPETFDAVISISSYEHDGLGRYGDPINPKGDLLAMEKTKRMLNPEGLLFLAVPVGRDFLVWNAHRVYGTVRLPLLLAGWKTVATYGFKQSDLLREEQYLQPIFVLKPTK